MHLPTHDENYEPRLDVEEFEGRHSSFSARPETDGYELNLGSVIEGAAGRPFYSPIQQVMTIYNTVKIYVKIFFSTSPLICVFWVFPFEDSPVIMDRNLPLLTKIKTPKHLYLVVILEMLLRRLFLS